VHVEALPSNVSQGFRWQRITRPLAQAQRLVGRPTLVGQGVPPPETGKESSWLKKRLRDIADVISDVERKLKSIPTPTSVTRQVVRRLKQALRDAAASARAGAVASKKFAKKLVEPFQDLLKAIAAVAPGVSFLYVVIGLIVADWYFRR